MSRFNLQKVVVALEYLLKANTAIFVVKMKATIPQNLYCPDAQNTF